MALANIVKSSLGPVGLDKMLVGSTRGRACATLASANCCSLPFSQVDSIGDITITNDGATILKLLEVDHPAAKVLVDLAELQASV